MAPPDSDDDPTAAASAAPEPLEPPEPAEPPPPEPKVKEILDAKTIAELERWFGLPSFQELAERDEPPPPDPDIEAVRERRAKAIEAVDPAMLEAHRRRVESGDGLLRFKAVIEVRVDPSVARFDFTQVEQKGLIAEPREVEVPEPLRDDLHDCTPQAILRDLHRPEMYFDKLFEIIDIAAEQRLDIVAAVEEAMRTSWKLPPLGVSPFVEARAAIAQLREDRLRDIAHFLPHFPNRRVTEP